MDHLYSEYYPLSLYKKRDIDAFLVLLGYEIFLTFKDEEEKSISTIFRYFSKQPYKSLKGVFVTVKGTKDASVAYIHTDRFRNKAENDFYNYTLKQLKIRFGGYFVSKKGKGKYVPFDGINREQDESGCYIAFTESLRQLEDIALMLKCFNIWDVPGENTDIGSANTLFNMCLVHILSVIESYFKNTYVALLTFSTKKGEILKSGQIRNFDLTEIANGGLRVEKAFANGLNFQNAENIYKNFDSLEVTLGIRKKLEQKYGRRKESFHDFIKRISFSRHRYVHHLEKYTFYGLNDLKKDIKFCELMIREIYKNIANKKGWIYRP